MKLLHYQLQIYILWLNYCSVEQRRVDIISRKHVPRIWNGKPAEKEQFPYQVGLMGPGEEPEYYFTFCGGGIIGKSKVLTAAHCLISEDERTGQPKVEHVDRIRITAGRIKSYVHYKGKPSKNYQWRTISSYTYPTKYEFPQHDIMVIKTNKPYEFNKRVGSLPYASKHIDYGAVHCTASGFGMLNKDQDNPVFTSILMWEEFKLLSQAACTRRHDLDMKNFICTESKEKDVTPGDSGGPLVCKKTGDPREGKKGIIVGVVCGENYEGNFYTRVSSYTQIVDECNAEAQKIACPQFCIFIGLTLFLLNL